MWQSARVDSKTIGCKNSQNENTLSAQTTHFRVVLSFGKVRRQSNIARDPLISVPPPWAKMEALSDEITRTADARLELPLPTSPSQSCSC